MQKKVVLLPKQIEFIRDQETRYLLYVGGYRSGKSYVLAHKVITLAQKNIGYEMALLSPTNDMLKRVMVPILRDALDKVGLPYTYRASAPNSFTLHFPEGNVLVHLLSAENYTRAAGLSLCAFFCDEFDLIDMDIARESWKMLVSRLTNGNVIQGCVSTTPEGFGFCQQFWEEEAQEGRRLIKVSTYDNPFIDPNYISEMRKVYPERQLEAYLHGDFCNLTQGNVYYNFNRETHHTNKTLADFPGYMLHIGADFNVNNSTLVTYVIKDKILHIIDEVTGIKNTEEMIKIIKQRYPQREVRLYPDAAGGQQHTNAAHSDIALLKQAGIQVYHHSKNPRVRDRINAVVAKLMDGNSHISLYINTMNCKNVTKTLEQQPYDPKTGAPDKTSGLDHTADAMGYVIAYLYPVMGRSTIQQY
jgi:PBSX family phage terminase large subunit